MCVWARAARRFFQFEGGTNYDSGSSIANSKDLFILDTNASDFAIGAELMHVQEGEERVIAYGSFSLTPEQQRYCSQEKSCLQSYVSPRNAIIIFLAENL